MGVVVQMCRTLTSGPIMPVVEGLCVRPFGEPDDVQTWLRLRARAFSDQTPAVRSWTCQDFEVEFLSKSWWRPTCMWFAEVEETHEAVGSVSLATRAGATGSNAAIHWLMVAPEWRRHGVGSLLLAELEQQCWQDGMRKVLLETHDGWHAALSFYEEHGYVRKS